MKPAKHETLVSLGFGQQWTARRVIAHEMKDEVYEWIQTKFTQAAPGEEEFISAYQRALSDYIDHLSADDLDAFEAQAERWNKNGPPPEIKQM